MQDESPKANEYQVGGSHYQSEYQHWDYALRIPLSYLEAASTKYVVRRHKKNGVEDLKKALHYLNKLEEDGELQSRKLTYPAAMVEAKLFCKANLLNAVERRYVEILSTWQSKQDLSEARALLHLLLDIEENSGSTFPVPLTEENHYAERAERDPTGW